MVCEHLQSAREAREFACHGRHHCVIDAIGAESVLVRPCSTPLGLRPIIFQSLLCHILAAGANTTETAADPKAETSAEEMRRRMLEMLMFVRVIYGRGPWVAPPPQLRFQAKGGSLRGRGTVSKVFGMAR